MNNFDFYNPTHIFFGKGEIEKVGQHLPENAKVLLLYGGGSIKKNGVYDKVIAALGEREVMEFGGIPANPTYAVMMQALQVVKENNITFMLAVGGGSVIDGTKFLSSAALYEGEEPWDILKNKIRTEKGLPFGTVLTLPATGSEMNSGAVITNEDTQEKFGMGGPGLFPQFSVLDPSVVASIPDRQISNGVVDAFTHVLEQYVTYPAGGILQDRLSESILQTLVEVGPRVLADRTDEEAVDNFMWSCTMALNGLIQKGVPTDWAIHGIGHELTAFYHIDHARTLAVIGPSLYRYKLANKKDKLAQLGERVFGITQGSFTERAEQTIDAIEDFFLSMRISVKLSDYTNDYAGFAEKIAARFEERGWMGIGEHGDITPKDVAAIIEMSYS